MSIGFVVLKNELITGSLAQQIKAENFCLFLASVGVLGVGCSVGWTSPTIKKLEKQKIITASQSSWIASAHEIGHFLSPFPVGYLVGKIGRIWLLLAASILAIAGWVLVLCFNQGYHIALLYASRVLFGLSMGTVFTVVPLYIAEVAPPTSRGALSTLFQAMLYLGHLLEYSAGPYSSYTALAIISMVVACTWLVTTLCMKESPVYLVQNGRNDKAIDNIAWLLNTNDSEIIRAELVKTEQMLDQRWERSIWDLFKQGYRAKLTIVCFAAAAQRFTGMSSVVAYAAQTFPSTKGFLNSDQYTILFGFLVFAFTFVSASLIDSLGRRPLMIASAFGCGVAHAVTAVYFGWNTDSLTWIPFLSITSFSVLYSLGIGPIVNTLQGELFPPELKGYASSIVTIVHAATSFMVTKSFQVIKNDAGLYVNFIIYAALCFLSSVIAYLFVPETKRKHLMETQGTED
ncbi:unnamed protein product [Nesidiocoris tenuis]|uniref:Major facilitator superfamily (MFS) profile domain-containing protein n=1 Tax=Nesidiocoris tenuis TaxID=355587 RepID=A0A6H5HMF4_9HEMI|nr:unnamed protein product [Nesidiocoris tenuis]